MNILWRASSQNDAFASYLHPSSFEDTLLFDSDIAL